VLAIFLKFIFSFSTIFTEKKQEKKDKIEIHQFVLAAEDINFLVFYEIPNMQFNFSFILMFNLCYIAV